MYVFTRILRSGAKKRWIEKESVVHDMFTFPLVISFGMKLRNGNEGSDGEESEDES